MIDKQKKIQHLFLRAGFGQPHRVIQRGMELPINEIVDKIFTASKDFEPLNIVGEKSYFKAKGLNVNQKKIIRSERIAKVKALNLDWFERMAYSNNFLREKMALFWHNHFSSSHKQPLYLQKQINFIRANALGNFRDLILAVSKDAVMISYLNNKQNRKGKPNENFAREVMELFTVGIGNYAETDIKEAARAFTGWTHDGKGNFTFKKKFHDRGVKTFLGKAGKWNGDDIINILLENKQTAIHLCKKIYKHFVNEKEDYQHVQELADFFYRNDYDIAKLMYKIFTSEWFYDEKNIGVQIKSPIAFLAGLSQTLEVRYHTDHFILFMQEALGQTLFDPPNVAGWPGGSDWIDSATLMLRLRTPEILFASDSIKFKNKNRGDIKASFKAGEKLAKTKATIDWSKIQDQFTTFNTSNLAEEISQYLFQVPVPPSILLNYKKRKVSEIQNMMVYALQLPEYQLC